ncbi:MAG: hypothetical protein ACJAS4_001810 [Bacteriovoracaceae bacterium]|jgi:hypothetical protein
MFKKTIVCSVMVMSFNLFAGELTQTAVDLEKLSMKITKLSEKIEYGNSRAQDKRSLRATIQNLIDTAGDMKAMLSGQGGNGGNPNPRPDPRPLPPQGPMYTAKCHIDDDPDLTFNQNVVDVRGSSIALLIDDCKIMAQAMYPTRSQSSGIKDIQINGEIPFGVQTGVCHIDDDPDMTFNQIVEGTIFGYTMADIINDCKKLADHAYGKQGSSGLQTINVNNPIPQGSVSGTCHIDDDPDMTFNQFVPGTVFGNSIQEISQDCRDLAHSTFGQSSASGLKDIIR